MKLLRITALATMLGLSSAVCATASTDSNYVCMITGAGINVHWRTDTAGNFYDMLVDAPQTGAAGYAAVGWNPTNPTGNRMIGSTILMGATSDLNTVRMYSPTNTNAANILATEANIPSTITQTAIASANNRITLRFRRTGVSTGNLLTIFAFGNTGTLSNHGQSGRAAQTIDLADGVAIPAPTCTASTDSNYVCMISGAGINVHWRTNRVGNYYDMLVDAPQTGAAGYAAVGWNPTNPTGNRMIGSTILMGATSDLNTVRMYSPANTNGANILATEATIPSTITQTAITSANNRITLRFRRTGVSTGNLLTIFAFGNTGTLSNHGQSGRAAETINLASVPACTASTDSNFVCMISGAGINVHWRTNTAGNYYDMLVDAPQTGANGYAAVGWNPTNPTGNRMIGSTILMGATSDLNTVRMYSPANTNGANILATEANIPSTITQTAIVSANNRITLRFRRTGVSTGNLLTIFAFGNTGTLSNHGQSGRAAATISLASVPATVPTCTASTDSNFVCMISGAGINVHWRTNAAGNYYDMLVDAPQTGAAGYAAVGWNPTNPTGNRMIGSTILMGGTSDLNTVRMYSPTNTNGANILATEATIPSTITQTAITSANNRITLRFRRTGVSTGNLLTIFAFGNTGTLSNHGQSGRAAETINLASVPACTASTDSNFVCMISGAGINVHWRTNTAGNYYDMLVDAPQTGANGYAAVGWNPTNPTGNRMIGSTILMGATSDLNTVRMYSPTNTNGANILATEATIPSTITQTAIVSANNRITLRFRRTGVSTGNLLTIFAFGNTGTLSNHGQSGRAAATISLASVPATVPTCTASTDSNFVCMISGAGINVHWRTNRAGNYYDMLVDAPQTGANGYAAVGWNPTNPTGNRMIGSTILMGATSDLNTVRMYSPTNTNGANILATEATIPSTITQTAIASANNRITLRFRRTGVSTGNLLTIFAFGNTGTLSNHGQSGRAAATINLASVTATAPVCTASTLVHTGTTNYQCMKALTNGVVIHWNMATTGTTAIAATSTNVNGWFAVAFPTNAGAMAPATSVAMSSATAAGIYAITAKSAAGIATTTSTVVDTPTVETANGLRILRYNAAVSILTANMAVNYAFHSSEIGFPVNIHSTRGSGTVDFVNPTPTSPGNPPVTSRTPATTAPVVVVDSDDSLSGGAIAGIVIGSMAFVVIVTVVVYCFCLKQKEPVDVEEKDAGNADSSPDQV